MIKLNIILGEKEFELIEIALKSYAQKATKAKKQTISDILGVFSYQKENGPKFCKIIK